MSQKLPKSEILRSKKIIQELFQASSSFLYLYPLQIRWISGKAGNSESNTFPQVLFVVPKKKFKKAVLRNLLRRRLKEVYRKNKASFAEKLFQMQYLAIIYIAKEPLSYQEIEKSFCTLLSKETEPKKSE
ncbi:ribonuclease P protein component [Raineya orbicola]|jgi:ribonuclease P protein component|uniref:Ribonuclease P protein component n=1 Tax=Raineya orbicola TaxID=2016530 RepID=A0A2N3IJU8_9BACT|nr:ribonuclease P protein component [Raineya orbicola]PKQ70528.1 rnpA: ribonuclease P protein component [Raineya orbicola]